ncbi:MAG: hypothetical protein ACYC11_06730, partial [Bellilinea sp.]
WVEICRRAVGDSAGGLKTCGRAVGDSAGGLKTYGRATTICFQRLITVELVGARNARPQFDPIDVQKLN